MQTGNPYIAGSPLRDPEGFFGRRDIIDWVSAELSNIHTNALVLYGQRRVGKTTILLQLRHSLSLDKYLPIYFDLQDQAKLRLGEVLGNLADAVGNLVELNEHRLENFDDEGKYFRSVFLPDLYRVLNKESRPVFLLDEFDVLDQGDEGSLENNVASRALFPLLRQVMDDDIRPAFVFVVGRRTEDLRVDFNQMFKTSLTKEVWVLDRLSAETLVRQAEVNETLMFTQQSIDRILQLSKNHAYLTQLVCQRLWQRAYVAKPAGIPTINVDDVTESIPDALEVGEQALIWLWNGLGPAEKIYAAVLAEISDEGKAISEDEVIKVLAEHAARARLRRREVELAPQDLITRHVLELTENREYVFAIELFRRWVKQKRSLKDVVDEIDKVDPLAQQLFELGQAYYKKREWSDAVRFFNDALRQNPSHFRANLLLGETFLAMGQTEDSVRQLEIACSLDSYESQYPLARALIALAKEKEKNNLDQDALSAAERALVISPNERLAQDIKNSILERQGDNAFKQGDLKAALFAFEKAKNAEKVKLVEREYKLKELQILEQEANSFTQKMEWKQAISIYEQLIEKAPDQRSKAVWQSGLARCKEEEKLESLFTLGLGALTSGDWEQAKKSLSEVVYIRPDYVKDSKSAVKLLEQAVSGRKPITVESIFQSNLFRVFGSVSLLIVVGYLVFITIQNTRIAETQNSTVASLALTETLLSSSISSTNTLEPTITPSQTITPTQVPVASILFQDNFESQNSGNWEGGPGTWIVKEDETGNYVYEGTGPDNYPQTWVGNQDWEDYAFESKIRIKKGTVFITIRSSGWYFYNVSINTNDISLARWNSSIGEYKVVRSTNYPIDLNEWYLVRVEVVKQQYKLYINNKLITTYTYEDDSPVVKGGIGYYIGGGDTIQVDNIRVWKLGEDTGLSPTSTPVPSTQSNKIFTPTAYSGSLPIEVADAKSVQMILVPAGNFTMGSVNGDADETPIHTVYLDAFYIDKYEVTNKLYKVCVDAGTCEPPKLESASTRSNYFGDSEFDNYPVVNIDWLMAKTYCEWRGAQLPTEAQWEKSARGIDGRTYPWGENIFNTYVNYKNNVGDTTPVGTYAKGKSIYGVYDMSGNVLEMVADWYSDVYYQNSPSINPLGPGAGTQRVARGGSWVTFFEYKVRSSYRAKIDLSYFSNDLGFRCVKDTIP